MTAARIVCRVALVLVASTPACALKKAAPGAADTGSASPGDVDPELAEAQRQLAANAAELDALGLGNRSLKQPSKPSTEPETRDEDGRPGGKATDSTRPGGDTPPPTKPSATQPKPEPKPTDDDAGADPATNANSTCERVCALAEVACDLSKRICTLADQHQGDARYEEVCWSAEQQCDQASDFCSDCTTC